MLRWATIHTPGSFPERNDILSPCEINGIAVSPDGETIYALDIPNSSTGPLVNAGIWKSADGGISWSRRPTMWLAQATPVPVFPVADIAMAPDDTEFIAAVCMDAAGTHRREVYTSEDGGVNWNYSSRIPWLYGLNEQIGDIAISQPYTYQGSTVHDIIVGSRNPADGLGQGEIYVLRYQGLAGWKAQGFGNGDVITLLPSADYASDSTIVVMSSSTQRTYINIGYRDLGANACVWNTIPGWPVELCTPDQAGGINSGEGRIITGKLALPDDFSGAVVEKRIVFAAYDSNGTALGTGRPLDDVYRLNDTIVNRLKVPGYGSNPRISSIAYTGTTRSGKLIAGGVRADAATAAATVWFTANPLAPCTSCPLWLRPLKSPTGGFGSGFANSIVAWTADGMTAFCATGSGNRDTPLKWSNPADASWNSQNLDESAFSLSLDNGTSWNQVGLIDTRINGFRAVAVSDDGTTVYVSSVNDNGLDSTWRSQNPIAGETWQRVLCIDGSAPLLRLAPDKKNGAAVFWGNQATTRVLNSRDSGQTWQDCLTGAVLQDIATKDSNELYVLQSNGLVRRGKYNSAGWIWDKFADTGLNLAHTIAVQQNSVLAGAALGQICPVSYSPDGGVNWIIITEPAPSAGNKHVAFDPEFKDNHLIFLADDAGGLYRWAVGTNNRWDDMGPPDNSYYGIATGIWGALYAAYSPLASGVDRTLYSRSGIPNPDMSWDSLTTGLGAGVLFRLEPTSLVFADEALWALDARDYVPATRIGCLWAFKDTLAGHSPWLISPKRDSLIYCDPVTGRNAQVDLKWQQLSLADAYQIEIGKDKWFDLIVLPAEPSTNPFYMPNDILYPAYYIADGLLPEAGKDYYWRVRVRRAATGQVIRSRWSPAFTFSIRPGYPVVASSYPGIQSLQPRHEVCDVPVYPVAFSWTAMQGATAYRFMLASDPGLQNPIIDEAVHSTAYKFNGSLNHKTAYYWQVTATEPIPGDPGPVFSFTTEDRSILPAHFNQSGDNTTNVLLITLIFVILFGLSVPVIIFHRRR